MYAPLSLVAMPELKEVLSKLKGHQARSTLLPLQTAAARACA